jgi:hypothetical protein
LSADPGVGPGRTPPWLDVLSGASGSSFDICSEESDRGRPAIAAHVCSMLDPWSTHGPPMHLQFPARPIEASGPPRIWLCATFLAGAAIGSRGCHLPPFQPPFKVLKTLAPGLFGVEKRGRHIWVIIAGVALLWVWR